MRHEITLVFPYKNFSRILLPVVIEKSIVVYLQLLSVVEIPKNCLLYGGHHGAIVVSITVGGGVYLVVSKRETDGQRGVKLCGISTLSSRSMDFLCGLLKFIL